MFKKRLKKKNSMTQHNNLLEYGCFLKIGKPSLVYLYLMYLNVKCFVYVMLSYIRRENLGGRDEGRGEEGGGGYEKVPTRR